MGRYKPQTRQTEQFHAVQFTTVVAYASQTVRAEVDFQTLCVGRCADTRS
jgi:hypothetical protein